MVSSGDAALGKSYRFVYALKKNITKKGYPAGSNGFIEAIDRPCHVQLTLIDDQKPSYSLVIQVRHLGATPSGMALFLKYHKDTA